MKENDFWLPDQAGSKIPDVSGLNVGFCSSLEPPLTNLPPVTSSDIHLSQTDKRADRNLPPTCWMRRITATHTVRSG